MLANLQGLPPPCVHDLQPVNTKDAHAVMRTLYVSIWHGCGEKENNHVFVDAWT